MSVVWFLSSPPPPPTKPPGPLSRSASDTMSSILAGLSPSFFEPMEYSTVDDVAIDWDSIERTMQQATGHGNLPPSRGQARTLPVPPNGGGGGKFETD